MEFKGTKGDWHVKSYFNNEDHLLLDKNGFQIGIIQEEYIKDHVKIKANAKLISCAPEMLALLGDIQGALTMQADANFQKLINEIHELREKATTI